MASWSDPGSLSINPLRGPLRQRPVTWRCLRSHRERFRTLTGAIERELTAPVWSPSMNTDLNLAQKNAFPHPYGPGHTRRQGMVRSALRGKRAMSSLSFSTRECRRFVDALNSVDSLIGGDLQEPKWRRSICSSTSAPSISERWDSRLRPWRGSMTWRYISTDRHVPNRVMRAAIETNVLGKVHTAVCGRRRSMKLVP